MKHAADILFGLRFGLDLYANIRPVKLPHPRLTPRKNRTEEDINFIIFRENTEGLYAGKRTIRFAFRYARSHGRKKLLMSDKSNALTYGHGLWQRVFHILAPQYPDIESANPHCGDAARLIWTGQRSWLG